MIMLDDESGNREFRSATYEELERLDKFPLLTVDAFLSWAEKGNYPLSISLSRILDGWEKEFREKGK